MAVETCNYNKYMYFKNKIIDAHSYIVEVEAAKNY